MRSVRLLILLSLVSLQATVLIAAQGPKHPDLKRRGRESAPTTDKAGKWKTERKEDVKKGPEKEGVDKKSTSREQRVSGHPKTRDKAGAWDRRQDRSGEARQLEGKSARRKRVEKASRWDKRPTTESRARQQAKLQEHVFRGWINGIGRPVGYHYEGTPAAGIKVVEGSRTKPDANGVYRANVEAGGVPKGYHTFFPRSWSRADVMKAINEASAHPVKTGKSSNDYTGTTSSGVIVGLKIKDGVVKTAYPIYEPSARKAP